MKPLLILSAGAFGQAVAQCAAERLQARGQATHLAPLPATQAEVAALVAQAGALALATWRPYPEQARWIDDACHAHGVAWSQVELHGTRLSCGPVVVPGQGPCHHCFQRRWASHHPAPERELVLQRAYARDPAMGLQGFIEPLVQIGASALLEDLDGRPAGRLRLLDVLTGAVQETAVLGVHACPRCGLRHEGPAGTRFVHHLAPAIEELLA